MTTRVMRKQVPTGAVKFDGINIKELKEFIDSNRLFIQDVSAIDTNFFPIPYIVDKTGKRFQIKNNDWVVFDNGEYYIYNDEDFKRLYTAYIPPIEKEVFKTFVKITPVKVSKINENDFKVVFNDGFVKKISKLELEKEYIPVEEKTNEHNDQS